MTVSTSSLTSSPFTCAAGFLLLVSSVAEPAPVFFNSRAAFDLAAGTLTEERFEVAFAPANTVQFNGFSIAVDVDNVLSSTDGSLVSEGSRAVTDAVAGNQRFIMDFDAPTIAFGLDINDWGDQPGAHDLTATSDTGSFLNHIIASAPPALLNGNTMFWGVIDMSPFNSITLDTGLGADRIGIDFAVHQTAVPEPTTLAMFANDGASHTSSSARRLSNNASARSSVSSAASFRRRKFW